jgi:hypothetical protein
MGHGDTHGMKQTAQCHILLRICNESILEDSIGVCCRAMHAGDPHLAGVLAGWLQHRTD